MKQFKMRYDSFHDPIECDECHSQAPLKIFKNADFGNDRSLCEYCANVVKIPNQGSLMRNLSSLFNILEKRVIEALKESGEKRDV